MEQITIQKQSEVPQMPLEFILNEKQRLVQIWGTVEIRDRHNQTLPLHPFFDRVMPVIMSRGGVVTYQREKGAPHSDAVVGKILNYNFAMNPEWGEEGLQLLIKLEDDQATDNEAWNRLKNGELMISFSGGGKAFANYNFQENIQEEIVAILEGFAFCLVPRGANPGAEIISINHLAKSDTASQDITDCNDTKAVPKVQQIAEDNEKTEKIKLISEMNTDIKQLGGCIMAENDAAASFVSKNDFDAFSKSVDDKFSGIAKSLESVTKSLETISKSNVAKADDDKKDDKVEKGDNYEDNLDPPASHGNKIDKSEITAIVKSAVSDAFQSTEMMKVMKSFGEGASTPRPSEANPMEKLYNGGKDIDYLELAQKNTWNDIRVAAGEAIKTGKPMEMFLNN